MASIITLTTDFGTGSPYVAQMKGAILSINPAAVIVDVSHAIRPQDVRHGAVVLAQTTPRFPDRSIHVAVVDPGVGTDRRIVLAQIGPAYYVAPDNGLLSRLTRIAPPSAAFELTDRRYWLPEVSSTFHGRDIMAPVAAHLSLGVKPSEFGAKIDDLVSLDWPEPRVAPGRIEGEVVAIDSFGNLTTNVPVEMLADVPRDQRTTVECSGQQTSGVAATYGQRPESSLVALVGSGGCLELAVVGGNAAEKLGATVGEPIVVRW